jgi:hypothetical protein
MPKRNLLLTGSHALASEYPYDLAKRFSETTHLQFHFVEYDDHDHPKASWIAILTTAALFNALQAARALRQDEED